MAAAGIIGVIVVLAFVLLGGGGGLGDLGSLAGQTVGPGQPPSGELAQECQTGEDANEREDCRILASINSVQAYWIKAFRGYEPTATRASSTGRSRPAAAGRRPRSGRSTARTTATSTSTSASSTSCSRSSAREGGPLAEAYILAHEYGHHVQNLTGVLRSADRDTGPQGGQVRVELQADCYAGLWVGNALDTGFIEDLTRQDVTQALDAAAAVGDDRIQERTQGRVTPESWTHGSAEQRQSWFVRGIEGSGPQSCDTFKGRV